MLEEALLVAADAKGTPKPGVSIVIPCLNEAATIGSCVKQAAEAVAEVRALVPCALLALGLAPFVALLTEPERAMLEIAGLSFSDHGMVLAAGIWGTG